MIDMLDKGHIIKLVESGLSFRQVSRETGVHRTTVSKYYNEYQALLEEIEETWIGYTIVEQLIEHHAMAYGPCSAQL